MNTKLRVNVFIVALGLSFWAIAQESNVKVDPPVHRLTPVPIQQVTIDDQFWAPKLKVWQDVTVPDCWTKFNHDRDGAVCINQVWYPAPMTPSLGAMHNFDLIAEGKKEEHVGPEWYDGLIYEMIRASADFLVAHPEPGLEKEVDGYIDRIAAAADRDPNGYIETWTELMAPEHRWGLNGGNDVAQHDLYDASALIDAGVHWYRATGQTKLLGVGVRMANNMCNLMGPPPKVNQVPGHPLGEEALINLYLLFQQQPQLKAQMPVEVNEDRYLHLAEFWIKNRGNHKGRPLDWGSYAQDDTPVFQQKSMEGHAVRDCLLCTGIALAGNVTGEENYLITAQRLWNNMVNCKMHITGGLGSEPAFEGFGPNYYLPNKTDYDEICAAVAGGFFDMNMNLTFGDARYADVLERELYNGALVGVSLKGDTYFYDNPLEVSDKHERWPWNPCPCCPPMFLKLMSGLPGYIYAQDPGGVYVNQFIGSHATLTINDTEVSLQQTTSYPWDGDIKLSVDPKQASEFTVFVRIPSWCNHPHISINGQAMDDFVTDRGYASLQRKWQKGDVINVSLPMEAQLVKANPKVEEDIGRVAIQRGPLIYCLEAVDNGGHVLNLAIPSQTKLHVQWRPDLLGGVNVIKGPALAFEGRGLNNDSLYQPANKVPTGKHVQFTAIPYYAQDNRQPGQMEVWVAQDPSGTIPLVMASGSN